MKNSCQRLFICFSLLLLLFSGLSAQKSDRTCLILVRHAEKDTSAAGASRMQADPPLSEQGLQRASKLLEIVKDYRVDSIFSTNFNRTRATVHPIALERGINITIYDPKNQEAFAERLKSIREKTVLVVGHSNTIPGLVNLLICSAKYPNLNDNEYDKIWILELVKGKYQEKQIQY